MVEDPDVTEEGAIVAAARPARIPLDEQAAKLPTSPGVYQFKSERGTVLYVGKAQNLRSRVRQYVSGATADTRSRRWSTARATSKSS